MHALYNFIPGKLFAGEIFFKQSLVSFGNRFGNGGLQAFQTVAHIRHFHFGRFAFIVIFVGFLVNQVNIAAYCAVFGVRHYQGANTWAKLGFQFLQRLIKVAVLHIQLAYKKHGGFFIFLRYFISLFRTYAYAVLTGKHN